MLNRAFIGSQFDESDLRCFAAIVVIYFPDTPILENLKKLSEVAPHLIVIDNTPNNRGVLPDFFDRGNISYVQNRSNRGLAFALNQGMAEAHKIGVETVFLFDQDSILPDHFFSKMFEFKKKIDAVSNNIAFYVPNFFDRNCQNRTRFPIIQKYHFRHYCCPIPMRIFNIGTALTVTSGTMISRLRYDQIGPFRDDYFIDFIDNEYNLRAGRNKLKIAINCDVTINHAVGFKKSYTICGLNLRPNNHNERRRYYIARNGIRTSIIYSRDFPSYMFLMFSRLLHEFLSILLFEKSKYKKCKAIFIGITHGIFNIMGENERYALQ